MRSSAILLLFVMSILLGCARTDEALKDAAMGLGTSDAKERQELERKLIEAGRRSIIPLVRALKLGDLETRIRAAEMLRLVGEKEGSKLVDAEIEAAAEALVEMVAQRAPDGSLTLSARDERLKLAVAKALGEMPAEIGVEVLLLLLNDANPDIRRAARDSLMKCGGRGAEHLMKCKFPEGSEGAKILEEIKFKLVQHLIERLIDKDEYDDIRRKAADALKIIGGSYITDPKPLAKFVLDEDEALRQRRIASHLLAQMDSEKIASVVKYLRKALEDEDGVIALNAAKALSRAGDKAAVDFVVNRLQDDNAMVRLSADDALDELGAPAVEQLAPRAKDEDEKVRSAIVRVLPVLMGTAAAPTLVSMLSDPDGDVRVAAALGLGRLKYKPSIHRLIRALDDRRSRVKYYAKWALRQFGEDALPAIEATVDSYQPYPCDKLAENITERAFEAFEKLGILMRRTAMLEAIRLEIFSRRMNLPVRHALFVEPKEPPQALILDAREAKAFISATCALTGLTEEELLSLVEDSVEAAERLGFKVVFCEREAGGDVSAAPTRVENIPTLADIMSNLPKPSAIRFAVKLMDEDFTFRERLPFIASGMWLIMKIASVHGSNLPERERIIERLVFLLENCEPEKNAPSSVVSACDAIRERAAQALGVMGGEEVIPPLLRALVMDSHYRVRAAASASLTKLHKGKEPFGLLQQYELALKSDDPDVRAAAAQKLGDLGYMQAVDILMAVFSNEKEELAVRRAAADALEKLTGMSYADRLPSEQPSSEGETGG